MTGVGNGTWTFGYRRPVMLVLVPVLTPRGQSCFFSTLRPLKTVMPVIPLIKDGHFSYHLLFMSRYNSLTLGNFIPVFIPEACHVNHLLQDLSCKFSPQTTCHESSIHEFIHISSHLIGPVFLVLTLRHVILLILTHETWRVSSLTCDACVQVDISAMISGTCKMMNFDL